uniref:Uncharacterized protein n=1 Tax=Rhizophora mucronata TaxID=61149 RepID=A0A2P2MXT3_RHIMU
MQLELYIDFNCIIIILLHYSAVENLGDFFLYNPLYFGAFLCRPSGMFFICYAFMHTKPHCDGIGSFNLVPLPAIFGSTKAFFYIDFIN